MADPGFSWRGAANSRSGYANLSFCKFFARNCMKMKEFGLQGGCMSLAIPPPPFDLPILWFKARSHGTFFLFVTAIYLHAILSNGTDCMWVYGSVHMVWFALRAMHFCVCNVTHEWVPYSFCAIAMCDSNICIANRIKTHRTVWTIS